MMRQNWIEPEGEGGAANTCQCESALLGLTRWRCCPRRLRAHVHKFRRAANARQAVQYCLCKCQQPQV